MSRVYDCWDEENREAGTADAASSLRKGELVVLPTDTVYGIGADAFNPEAVAVLLDAKGRGRNMPAPVLVGTVDAASALVEDFGKHGEDLIDAFWPGPLTLVCPARSSLTWDLGDTKGTVGVRMPDHELALDLLRQAGPTAVSSANLSGESPALTAAEAMEQLGDSVSVYLENGPAPEDVTPSTIVDLTYAVPRVLREGAISIEDLRKISGTVIGVTKRPRRRTTEQPESAEKADAGERAPGQPQASESE